MKTVMPKLILLLTILVRVTQDYRIHRNYI